MICSQWILRLEAHSVGIASVHATSLSALRSNTLQTKGSHKHCPGASDYIRLHTKDVMGNCNY